MKANTIDIDSDEKHKDKSVPESIHLTVYGRMGELGYNVSEKTVESYKTKAGSPFGKGKGLLPTFVTGELATQMRQGGLMPMDLGKVFKGTFTEESAQEGSSFATRAFTIDEMSLKESVDILHETGQIDVIKKRASLYTDYENLDEIAALEIATKSKGWMAETIIGETDYFNLSTISHDQGGIDAWADGKWADENGHQIKSVTFYASQDTKALESKDINYLWYQWDCDGHLVIGNNANQVNKQARKAKLDYGEGTLIKRSTGDVKRVKESDRNTARYIFW